MKIIVPYKLTYNSTFYLSAHGHMNIPCEQHYRDDLHDPFAAHFLQQSVCVCGWRTEG